MHRGARLRHQVERRRRDAATCAARRTSTRASCRCPQGCTQYDCNGDGVFNVVDYAGDSRVNLERPAPRRSGRACLTPQDLLIAFSDGTDDDGNGFVDDIAGWDFLDDDNDAYDDVQYGHGTGEAEGSTRRGQQRRATPARARTACSSRCASATRSSPTRTTSPRPSSTASTTASLVIQEALGTLNNTQLARQAVEYAYDHGVAVIASAADEAAQHHNWPSNYPHTIVVNSVTQYDTAFTPELRPTSSSTAARTSRRKITRRDPEHELLVRRDRRRLRPRRPRLQRGAERDRRQRPRPASDLRARERRPLPAERQRGAPADGLGDDQRRPPGGRRQLRDPAGAVLHAGAAPGLHRQEPPVRRRRPPTARSPSPLVDHARAIRRARTSTSTTATAASNMVKTDDAIAAGDDPAGGRDHLARVVRAGRPDPADGGHPRARSTRAAAPTPAGSRSRPAPSRTTAARPTFRRATSSRSPRAGATGRTTRARSTACSRRST